MLPRPALSSRKTHAPVSDPTAELTRDRAQHIYRWICIPCDQASSDWCAASWIRQGPQSDRVVSERGCCSLSGQVAARAAYVFLRLSVLRTKLTFAKPCGASPWDGASRPFWPPLNGSQARSTPSMSRLPHQSASPWEGLALHGGLTPLIPCWVVFIEVALGSLQTLVLREGVQMAARQTFVLSKSHPGLKASGQCAGAPPLSWSSGKPIAQNVHAGLQIIEVRELGLQIPQQGRL